MKNKCVILEDGTEAWISRSIAVLGIIFVNNNGCTYVVANKRGIGCPDEIGKWCIPGGYLDYDESLEEAATREVEEENKYYIDPDKWKLLMFKEDHTKGTKQTITFIYYTNISFDDLMLNSIDYADGEANEVEDDALIALSEIDRYDWAFNQLDLLHKISKLDLK